MLDPLQLFERLTAREFLATMGELRQMERRRRARTQPTSCSQTLQLADDADRQIAGYSHGMRKKTALAAAVLHRPRLLLLDEPFEGVDPVSARTMRAMLDRFRSGGGTVVLSSHVMDLVERLCDHVGVIHRGQLVATGPTDDVAQRSPSRGRLHRRRRRDRRSTHSPGWAGVRCPDPQLRRAAMATAARRDPPAGSEQVGVIVSTVASALIGVGRRVVRGDTAAGHVADDDDLS